MQVASSVNINSILLKFLFPGPVRKLRDGGTTLFLPSLGGYAWNFTCAWKPWGFSDSSFVSVFASRKILVKPSYIEAFNAPDTFHTLERRK